MKEKSYAKCRTPKLTWYFVGISGQEVKEVRCSVYSNTIITIIYVLIINFFPYYFPLWWKFIPSFLSLLLQITLSKEEKPDTNKYYIILPTQFQNSEE